MPTLANFCNSTNRDWISVSALCHVLLFYGTGPTDLPGFASGAMALSALTDESKAAETFGQSPFIRTRNGVRYRTQNDPVFHSELGEAHRDQCLATFAALDLPLTTPIHLTSGPCTIADLLSESIANFSLDQKELAWTTLALAKYLPPKKEWVSRFREPASFSQLAQALLQTDPHSQSCAGTHTFQALVALDNADHRSSILDGTARKHLDSWLTAKIQEVVRSQRSDGSWDRHWCAATRETDGTPASLQDRVMVSGHLLEALNSISSLRRPPDTVYDRAAGWLAVASASPEISPDRTLICPMTHAIRAAAQVRPRTPGTKIFDPLSATPLGAVADAPKHK